jgi:antitoxin PrlF
MATATLTSKGQVTIPQEVRNAMRLTPGDRIDFVRMEDGNYAIIPASVSVKALKGFFPRPEKPASLEEMEAAIIAGATGR